MDRTRMKGNLEVILLTVIADEGPLYGLEIVREVQSRTQGALVLAAGSLYPPLHRLEKRGWIRSETRRSPHGSGTVTYYTVTEAGRDALAEQRELTKTFIQTLQELLRL